MKWRPILFSGEMVRAIFDGRKTETRRVLRLPASVRILGQDVPVDTSFAETATLWRPSTIMLGTWEAVRDGISTYAQPCPYGAPGDGLWVREAHHLNSARCWAAEKTINPTDPWEACYYRAGWDRRAPHWRPSIHMPKWACRLFLRVLEVRVERVQDITWEAALAEGVVASDAWGAVTGDDLPQHPELPPNAAIDRGWADYTRAAFRHLWDAINAKRGYGWDANPWVWVVRFERTERPEDWTS